MVTKDRYEMLYSTPDTIDSLTPNTNSNEQKLSLIPQDEQNITQNFRKKTIQNELC